MDRFAKLLPFAAALVLSACAGYAAQSCRHAGAGYYCVKQGDTLYRIGKRFGVPVDSLKRWNGLSGNHIQAGQMLRVSDGGRVRRVQQKPLPQPQWCVVSAVAVGEWISLRRRVRLFMRRRTGR